MSKFSNVWVFSDNVSRLPELMGGAHQLGEQVNAFALTADSATAFQFGAHAVFALEGKPDNQLLEDYADTIAETIRQHSQSGLILLPATRRGKLLAARLGARLVAAVSNDVAALEVDAQGVTAQHMVYGGLAFGKESIHSSFSIVTLSTGVFEPALQDASLSGTAQIATYLPSQNPIICISKQVKQSDSVDLDKAKLVVSVGRGIGSKENIAIATSLCEAMGAELACSRPVAENEKWMEHDRYVGISNLMIKPDLYLAIGISGQIQHMVGANGAQTIVAINKDKNAPIFQYADYGIVGDLFKIVPALTQVLNHR
ncbi:FAD-binding protein [Aeromonas hydrophila]